MLATLDLSHDVSETRLNINFQTAASRRERLIHQVLRCAWTANALIAWQPARPVYNSKYPVRNVCAGDEETRTTGSYPLHVGAVDPDLYCETVFGRDMLSRDGDDIVLCHGSVKELCVHVAWFLS